MKFLFFSDMHFFNFPQFSHTHESGLNSRLLDQMAVIAQIRQVCVAEDVDAAFMLGDLFHSRTKLDVDVAWCAQTALRELIEVVPEVHLLVGNHDQSTRDGSIHSLEVFSNWPKVHVIDKPERFYVGDQLFYAHPFTTDYEAFTDYCKSVPLEAIFLAHQGISEALVGAFEVPLKADIPCSALPDAKLVLLGHYHKHQWLRSNVAYIGSPLQLDFGERTEEKGFLLVETEPDSLDFQWKFIPSNAPRFKLYEDPVAFDKDVRLGRVDPERDFVRVHGPARKLKKIQDSYARVQTIAEALVTREGPRIDAKLAASDRDLLTAYLDGAETPLDKQRLLNMGLSALEER